MGTTISDIYFPLICCPKCSKHMLLESTNWENIFDSLQVRCITCNTTFQANLDIFELFINNYFPECQTWRIKSYCLELNDGLLITGSDLFTTSKNKDKLISLDSENQISNIAQRENDIIDLMKSKPCIDDNIELAYHIAAANHKCIIRDGYSPQTCKEKVNFIASNAKELFSSFFNIYSLIKLTWEKINHCIKNKQLDIANETELRTNFINEFKNLNKENSLEYDIQFWEDRYIKINGNYYKPDIQMHNFIGIELKSFFKEQSYTLHQAKELIVDDLIKIQNYNQYFKVAFFMCFSNCFKSHELLPDNIPSYNFPVNIIISSV